jgi:AcrR family transcriptional regulator
VAAATVRYYLASGLLPPPRRAKTNRFLYDERHVEVIRLIRLLQDRRNLSLDTIGRMLPDLLPDLTGTGERSVFRPEMWGQLLAVHFPATSSPSPMDRLREAGMVAFAHHGYADVSVDDVCRATGIAKGSFYRHYSSKEELFFATVIRVGEVVSTSLVDAGEPGPPKDAVEVVAAALQPYMAIVFDLASLASQRRPGYSRALRGLVAQLATAFHDLAAQGAGEEVTAQPADQLARGLVEQAIARAMVILAHERVREGLPGPADDQLTEVHQAG